MAYVVGAVLALAVGLFGTMTGLDRERGFYTTITIVIAFLYSLFAVMGGAPATLGPELLQGTLFVVVAVVGFRGSLWLVVAALAGHGIMDLFHGRVIANAGVPAFWPAFCSTYDVVAAGYLAWLLRSGRLRATR